MNIVNLSRSDHLESDDALTLARMKFLIAMANRLKAWLRHASSWCHRKLSPVKYLRPTAVTGFNLAHAVESKLRSVTKRSELATEWLFIIISLVVAGIGIGLGFLFYVKDTRLPDIWAARLRPLYDASYNKYWVDEFFGWAMTRRVMDAARAVFAFDSKVIDGGVNGTAWFTRLSSRITGATDQVFCRWSCQRDSGFHYPT